MPKWLLSRNAATAMNSSQSVWTRLPTGSVPSGAWRTNTRPTLLSRMLAFYMSRKLCYSLPITRHSAGMSFGPFFYVIACLRYFESCKCSLMNLPVQVLLKDKDGKILKDFSVPGPQDTDVILLWIWRDLFAALIATGHQ